MRKHKNHVRIYVLFICILIVAGCCTHTEYTGVLAVREACCRYQADLPLSDADIDSILAFIGRGGKFGSVGFTALTDTGGFRPLFNIFRDSADCREQSLLDSPDYATWIDGESPRIDVFDARAEEGPDVNGRRAFLHKSGFWLIFYVDTTDLGSLHKEYDELIVQKAFAVPESEK